MPIQEYEDHPKVDSSTFVGSMMDEDCPKISEPPTSVAVDESCDVSGMELGTFTPVIEWFDDSPRNRTYTTPIVGNLTDDNGDGVVDNRDTPDIVLMETNTGATWVFSGDGSGLVWTTDDYVSKEVYGMEPPSPAIGDLDGDGEPDIVVGNSYGIHALRGRTGEIMWSQSDLPGSFDNWQGEKQSSALVCGGLGIFDMEADGRPEVVLGHIILNGQTGAVRGGGEHGRGTGFSVNRHQYHYGEMASMGVAADIDLDGQMEVVVGNALYTVDGDTLWYNGEEDGFVAIGNFDDDPYGEIVSASYPGEVRLQDDDGTVLWKKSFPSPTIGPPTIADFDGDGEPEIGVAGKVAYWLIDTDGSLMWQHYVRESSSGFTGSSAFDFEGDGKVEVVYADEVSIYIFDGATGAIRMEETRHTSATCTEYPVIVDVDGDGSTEIVVAESIYPHDDYNGVLVIGDLNDSWQPSRPIWNQHGYSITNVLDNGELPVTPEPSWLTHNTFRSGDLTSATAGATSDAVPILVSTCTIDCDEDLLTVVVQVGNAGVETLPAGVPVSLYSIEGDKETFLASQIVSDPIPSGQSSESLLFKLDVSEIHQNGLKLVVDDDRGMQRVGECHEDNNSLVITEGLCR